MAVKDVVPVKYWIPKIDFTVRLGASQYFKVMYKLYAEDWNSDTGWTTLREQYLVQPDGTTSITDKLILTGLQEYRDYVLRFVDTRNKNYNFKFRTGKNIALSDSPYYDKVLMPGQIYDWYINGMDVIGAPSKSECDFYYALSGKKGVTIDTDNWGSMVNYTVGDNGLYKPTTIDGRWAKVEDDQGNAAMGTYINNVSGNPVQMLAFPNLKYDGSDFKAWHAYWVNDGGGGISFDDVRVKNFNIGFSFLVEEYEGDGNDDRTLLLVDTSKVEGLNAPEPYIWKLQFNRTCQLKSIYTDSANAVKEFVDTNVLKKNHWYYIALSSTTATLYELADKTTGEIKTTVCQIKVPENIPTGDIKEFHIVTPLIFGSPDTKGVVIGKIGGNINTGIDSSYISKVVNPEKFIPRLRLAITYDDYTTEVLDEESKFTSVVESDKVSFLIDPDVFVKIKNPNGRTVAGVEASIVIDGNSRVVKRFSGFTYEDVLRRESVSIPPLLNPKDYIQESFELDFASQENPIKALAQYFFTKHGTWGGYNGGVNGHNLYFNGDGNLILENHGDKYTGTLKGVNKESDVSPYTGYGGEVPYGGYAFDGRTNKSCLRTGTALVSNKYFTYGRCDVNLKLPVGCWGVCPAIWLFHYIEISEADYRYNQAPYNERNAQGSSEDGFYRVVNNEIDIELPSQLTNGVLDNWSILQHCYFDMDIITTDLIIGVKNGSDGETGLFQLNNISAPNSRSSWTKVGSRVIPRYEPDFSNCKFNNWIGEREAGCGWAAPVFDDAGTIKYTAEQVYKGIADNPDILKEEYSSQLLKLAESSNAYADDRFHKWSIVWLPDRTLLLVDDKLISENRGFVPFNHMKLTIAGWFPTMPLVTREATDAAGNVSNIPSGVKDRDGIHGVNGGIIDKLDDTAQTSIGTWAGTRALWDVLHMEVKSVKWDKYNVGDQIDINGKVTTITSEPGYLGESFPESGLRLLVEP